MKLLERVFPPAIDSRFPGKKPALYAFYLITAVTIVRSCIHLFAPDGGAESIATIPLGSYSPDAAAAVISIFSLWGLSQLLIGMLYLLASLRYHSLIPLFYLLMAVEYLGRFLIGRAKPIATAGTAPGAVINLPIAILAALLFCLSVNGKEGRT